MIIYSSCGSSFLKYAALYYYLARRATKQTSSSVVCQGASAKRIQTHPLNDPDVWFSVLTWWNYFSYSPNISFFHMRRSIKICQIIPRDINNEVWEKNTLKPLLHLSSIFKKKSIKDEELWCRKEKMSPELLWQSSCVDSGHLAIPEVIIFSELKQQEVKVL